jgi:pyridoxal phosphate enzyme (YggS family)
MSGVAGKLNETRAAIAAAERAAGRAPGSVDLVAVTKTHGEAMIREAIAAGQRRFGENRVQEAKAKWPAIRSRHDDIRLHLIGPLQSNKAQEAIALFDVIETVDREKIAAELARQIARSGRRPRLFVQVNTGEEPQKAGIAPQDAAAFVEVCRSRYGLDIAGLMCIPPVDENPGPHFALLARLAAQCGLKELSMGMSQDFATAIAFGATQVRVGSAIFGAR